MTSTDASSKMAAESTTPRHSETPADNPASDGVEAEGAALPPETSKRDCAKTPLTLPETSEKTPPAVNSELSAGISAEELMAIWSRQKPNTQWRGRQWVADGCPAAGRPDEHPIITENLLPFRVTASKASEAERQRFLGISAPRS